MTFYSIEYNLKCHIRKICGHVYCFFSTIGFVHFSTYLASKMNGSFNEQKVQQKWSVKWIMIIVIIIHWRGDLWERQNIIRMKKARSSAFFFLAFVGNSLSTIISPIALEPKGHKIQLWKSNIAEIDWFVAWLNSWHVFETFRKLKLN